MQQVQGIESHVSQKKTHESGHLHLQPLSWSILSWVKVQTGWGYCRCTLSYLIISQIKPSDIHPFNWVSSNTENKSFPWVCTGIDRHIWSQTHDSISSDQWDVKQDVDERWSGREQTIDSHRRPLRGLLPFFYQQETFLHYSSSVSLISHIFSKLSECRKSLLQWRDLLLLLALTTQPPRDTCIRIILTQTHNGQKNI